MVNYSGKNTLNQLSSSNPNNIVVISSTEVICCSLSTHRFRTHAKAIYYPRTLLQEYWQSKGCGIAYDSPNSFHYLALKEDAFYLVEETFTIQCIVGQTKLKQHFYGCKNLHDYRYEVRPHTNCGLRNRVI